MARQDNITEIAVATLAFLREAEQMLQSPNDIGEASGFHDEFDALMNDAYVMIGMLRNRARLLKLRLQRNSTITAN